MSYRSDKSEGPTAGTETVHPLEFLARVVVYTPYFAVHPLASQACHGAMRIVAFITQPSVIDQILAHLRTRATIAAHAVARSPPSTRGPSVEIPSRRVTVCAAPASHRLMT